MKLRTFFTYLAVSVSGLLLIGGVGWFWIAAHSPFSLLQGVQTTPSAAMFVPRQAPLMVSLLVNPDRLAALRQAITPPGSRRRSRTEWSQFRQSLLTSTGLDYRSDIQPWLGDEITFAVTTPDLDRQRDNGLQPGYLLAMTVQQPEASRQFLERFWQKQALKGQDLVFEQYQGVKLIYGGTSSPASLPPPPSVATAMIGDQFVLLANHPRVLRSVINNVQAPDLDISSDPDYQQAIQELDQGQIGLAFLNLAELTRGSTQEAADSPSPRFMGLGLSIGLNPQGLLAETALVGAAVQPDLATPLPQLSQPAAALGYIPAQSGLIATGVDLNQLWTQLQASLAGYDLLAPLINRPIQDLEQRWRLSFTDDVLSWVKGEYALAVVPAAAGLQTEWLLVAQETDSELVTQGLQHLDQIAQAQGLGTGPLTLAGQTITTWTQLMPAIETTTASRDLLGAQVVGGHARVDGFALVASSLPVIEAALQAPQDSLLTSDQFQGAIAPLPSPNAGYLYLDWPASRPLLERQFPLLRAIEAAGQPFFNHLRSLTLTSYRSNAPVQRGKLFIQLS